MSRPASERSRHTAENPNRRSSTTSNKRERDAPGDPQANGRFSDHPWYDINHELVKTSNDELCDHLIVPLRRYASIDQGIADLIEEAEDAKKLPEVQRLDIAVPGEQGIGKSTGINAILGRNILSTSNESKADTAFATIITVKKGASDDTRVSDVIIKFHNFEEMKIFINDMINRWRDMYPNGAAGRHGLNEKMKNAKKSESNEEASPEDPIEEREVKKRGAKGAREFFDILFDTDKDVARKRWLDNALQNTDIRKGDFRDACHEQAQFQLRQLGIESDKGEHRREKHEDKSDKELRGIRSQAKKKWPFVKVMIVRTGHVLLRAGLCLYDLPGMFMLSLLFAYNNLV